MSAIFLSSCRIGCGPYALDMAMSFYCFSIEKQGVRRFVADFPRWLYRVFSDDLQL